MKEYVYVKMMAYYKGWLIYFATCLNSLPFAEFGSVAKEVTNTRILLLLRKKNLVEKLRCFDLAPRADKPVLPAELLV